MKTKNETSTHAIKQQKVELKTQWEHLLLHTRVAPIRAWLAKEHTLFSGDEQETVTNADLMRMAHTGIAFCVMVMSANVSAVIALVGVIWFATAMADVRKSLKKKQK